MPAVSVRRIFGKMVDCPTALDLVQMNKLARLVAEKQKVLLSHRDSFLVF